MAAVFWVSPGNDELPCHTALLDSHPTADLASRSRLQPLRADSNQHSPSCGFRAPVFGVPRTGLSHYRAMPDTASALFDNQDLNLSVGLEGRCSTN